MKEYQYIFFDFDGTLVNTLDGTKKSALYALKYFNIEVPNPENIGKIFCGPPLKESFQKFNLNEFEIEKAIKLYREYQIENTIKCNSLYNGVDKMLATLKEKGKNLIVVTAKLEQTTIKILDYMNILKYFDIVSGATADGTRTIKKDIMKYAINKINDIDLNKSIMIGDRASDIKTGIANNMDTVGILYGMDSRIILEKAGATYFASKAMDILNIIK